MGVYMVLCIKVLSGGANIKKSKKKTGKAAGQRGELLKGVCPKAARAITKPKHRMNLAM